jgi:hypothetical protein
LSGPIAPARLLFALSVPLFLMHPAWAAQPAPLACPAGTSLRTVPYGKENARIETCHDLKTKLRSGPTRVVRNDGIVLSEGQNRNDKRHGRFVLYDDDGKAQLVSQYVDGEIVDKKMTRRGMDKVLAEQSAIAKKKGKRWRQEMLDDHTVLITVVVQAPYSWVSLDPEKMREKLLSEAAMCRMFSLPADLRRVIARYENSDGQELATVMLTRTDCADAGKASTSSGKG